MWVTRDHLARVSTPIYLYVDYNVRFAGVDFWKLLARLNQVVSY